MDVLLNLFPSDVVYTHIIPYMGQAMGVCKEDLSHGIFKIKTKEIQQNIVKYIFKKTGWLCSSRNKDLEHLIVMALTGSKTWGSISIYGYKNKKTKLFFVTLFKNKASITDVQSQNSFVLLNAY